jgi:hypothetical protein
MEYHEKAQQNLKSYIKIVKKLFIDEDLKFDLLIGAGDSGLAMVSITELILVKLKVPVPEKLLIPYQRFTKMHVSRGVPFDNSALIPDIVSQIKSIKSFNKTIFVDDEIGHGSVLMGIIELLKESFPSKFTDESIVYVLAEDHGFIPNSKDLKIKFLPFSKKTKGMNNVVSRIIPPELWGKLEEEYGEFYPVEMINTFMNLPVKVLENNKPIWSYDLLNDVKSKVKNINKYQVEFESYLDNYISSKL